MLLGDLFTYNILEKSDEQLKAEIIINANHKIFDGHFPGVPVLPGVCQVQVIKEILQDATNCTLQYSKVRDIKFMSMVNPNEMGKLQCEMSFKPVENDYKTTALLKCDDTNILKLRGNLSKK